MPMLQQKDREAVRLRFDTELKRDVQVTLYTQSNSGLVIPGRVCRYCGPTQELLEEVSALSQRVLLEVVDFYKNGDEASSRGIARIPALTIGRDGRDNVRFYGMPSGFAFAVLLDSIIAASDKRSTLPLETRRQLKGLKEDVHVQVFVTANSPGWQTLARAAYTMAIESDKVIADVLEIRQLPELVQLYNVMGVPKTVINDKVQFTGPASEDELLRLILEAAGPGETEPVDSSPVPDERPVA
jgi:glutaredoxin-like protein